MSIQYTTKEQIEQMREELNKAKEKSKKRFKKYREQEGEKKPAVKRIFSFLFYGVVVFLLIILASVLLAKGNGNVPSVFGYQLYVVKSGSMSPTLEVGSVILSKKPKDNYSLKINDVVTFKTSGGAVVTHRIIEVVTEADGSIKYRTKGDNPANSPDIELLDPKNILAKFICKIPLT